MMQYHEALSRCLEAIAQGRDLESTIAEMPAGHRERLRQDATLSEALRHRSTVLPPPTPGAEANALSRLHAELSTQRAARESPAPRGFFGLPRFALAGLALAALLIGAGLIIAPNQGDNGTVEAAEFEGVVVANSDGSLTVQTLDSLEEVTVPLGAAVLDQDGNELQLGAIEAGEVVFVRGNRDGPLVRAQDIRRRLDGLPGWCDENGERCRQIAQNLRDAQARCESRPEACHFPHDRVSDLIARVTDVADLEDARRRLHELEGLCNDRDTRACREIGSICEKHPFLCGDAPVRPFR
jgi:hypothetical protein